MLKRTIGLGLLCMASHAYSANIVVNTTADEFDDKTPNSTCSLREAIELINRTDVNGKIPEEGFGGCSGKDATPTIVLETGKTYQLSKQIQIKKSLSINVLDEFSNATKYGGENNATIQAMGAHRLFLIDDQNPNISSLDVSIGQVNLVGCAAEGKHSTCESNGGLIFNRENLSLSYVRLSGGAASSNGGAIFNEGVVDSSNAASTGGQLVLSNTNFLKNKAAQGAALFSQQPSYSINNSVLRDNEVTAQDGAIIYVNRPVEVNSNGVGSRLANIANTTIFNNTGRVINLIDGMTINNSTIIKNTAGIYLNAQNGAANLANSIVAENGSADCMIASGNKATVNNVLYKVADVSNDCGKNQNGNVQLGKTEQLLANNGINGGLEGKCDQPPGNGLLCPFAYQKEIFNGFFKPRLLTSYQSFSDSLIVNKGQAINGDNSEKTLACTATDQRGVIRESRYLCNIGSIELVIEERGKVGQDIKFGQTAEIDLTDYLGDGQLWPKQLCDDVFSDLNDRPKAPEGGWQDGCLRFVPGKEATKGELSLSHEGLLRYVPFRNYHGSDNFTLNIVTTTSRFSQAINDRVISLRGTIVQEPEDTFKNRKVNLSGGSTGLLSAFGLLSLAWLRRRLQGEK